MPTWTLLIDPLTKLLDKIVPDPDARDKLKAALAEQENQIYLQEMQLALEADRAQTEINKTEAANPDIFVAGWRPFIGWVCGVAFAYHFIMQPLLAFAIANTGASVILPAFDMQELSTVLMGMLGLGSLRTLEKINNINK